MTNQQIIDKAKVLIEYDKESSISPTWKEDDLINWAIEAQENFILKVDDSLLQRFYTISQSITTIRSGNSITINNTENPSSSTFMIGGNQIYAQKVLEVSEYISEIVISLYFMQIGTKNIKIQLRENINNLPSNEIITEISKSFTLKTSLGWKKFIIPILTLPKSSIWLVISSDSSTIDWGIRNGNAYGSLLLSIDNGNSWTTQANQYIAFSIQGKYINVLDDDFLKLYRVTINNNPCDIINDIKLINNSLYAGTSEFPICYLRENKLFFPNTTSGEVEVIYIRKPYFDLKEENELLPTWQQILPLYIVAKAFEKDKQYSIAEKYMLDFNNHIALINQGIGNIKK